MNDFDYDVLQKKRIASGAKHIKRGSRSKKCTLPSDYLTAKERKGLNGVVETYNLSVPMKWKDFRELPNDLQQEYMDGLLRRYDLRQWMVADMFGISDVTFSLYCKNNGIQWADKSRKKATPEALKAFEGFLGRPLTMPSRLRKQPEDTAPVPALPEEKAVSVQEEAVPAVQVIPRAEIRKGSLSMTGNMADIASKLVSWLGVNSVYNVTIDFEVRFEVRDV